MIFDGNMSCPGGQTALDKFFHFLTPKRLPDDLLNDRRSWQDLQRDGSACILAGSRGSVSQAFMSEATEEMLLKQKKNEADKHKLSLSLGLGILEGAAKRGTGRHYFFA